MDEAARTLIVGAGLAGSALAMHLAERGEQEVVVIDPDMAGARSSSELNAGGVRATWWQPVNVELCAHTIDFLRAEGERVGFRPRGYLWLYGADLWDGAVAATRLQNRFGRQVELLDPAAVARRWPFIDRLDGIVGATFSPLDGLVDANAVKELFRERARAAGARFLDRRLLVGVEREGTVARAARVRLLPDQDAAHGALVGSEARGTDERLSFEHIVNAAGPWAAPVTEMLGAPIPCRAVRRQVSVVATRDVDLSEYGMVVDTTGLYFHHEAGDLMLAGFSPPDDPPGYSFRYDGRRFFEEEIWPRLAARSSAMDRLDHVRGWAGLYELSPDNSALVGAAQGLDNAYEIHSFSGRGVMQSYAAALSLAELMTDGAYVSFPDTAALAGSRFTRGALQPEELHI